VGIETWWQFIRRTKNPELPVVLLEDFGALVGLAFALAGITLAEVFHEPRFDAVGSLAIGLLLVVIAIVLAVEMASLLIGEAASADDVADDLRRARRRTVGPPDHPPAHAAPRTRGRARAAKVEFEPSLSMAQLALAIDGAEARLRAAYPAARLVFLEPDLYPRSAGRRR